MFVYIIAVLVLVELALLMAERMAIPAQALPVLAQPMAQQPQVQPMGLARRFPQRPNLLRLKAHQQQVMALARLGQPRERQRLEPVMAQMPQRQRALPYPPSVHQFARVIC